MARGSRIHPSIRAHRRRDIVRLAHAGHDLPLFLDAVVCALREAVPCEAGCWHALDPVTLLETSYKAVNLPIENPLAAEIEYLHEDYNQFAVLARSASHSGILSVATGGAPERSQRYRELIRPSGLAGELRTTFVSDGAAWGAVCLLRERSSGDFADEEASFLEELSGHVGHGIRSAQLLQEASADPGGGDGPGLILLDGRQRLEAVTAHAEHLIEELSDVPPGEAASPELPYVVHAVAAKARLAGRTNGADTPARARVRTRSGRWLELYGCLLAGDPKGKIAVVAVHSDRPRLRPALAETYGLTARESEVLRCLLQGWSTKEMAAALRISPYTVQEHVTAIFDKTGVRSRRQLTGEIFCRLYAPAVRQQLGLGPVGSAAPSRNESLNRGSRRR